MAVLAVEVPSFQRVPTALLLDLQPSESGTGGGLHAFCRNWKAVDFHPLLGQQFSGGSNLLARGHLAMSDDIG